LIGFLPLFTLLDLFDFFEYIFFFCYFFYFLFFIVAVYYQSYYVTYFHIFLHFWRVFWKTFFFSKFLLACLLAMFFLLATYFDFFQRFLGWQNKKALSDYNKALKLTTFFTVLKKINKEIKRKMLFTPTQI